MPTSSEQRLGGRFYLWFAFVLAFALAFTYVLSDPLAGVTSEQFVYGGDTCPQDDELTCAIHPVGSFLLSVVGMTIAVLASYPIVRSRV